MERGIYMSESPRQMSKFTNNKALVELMNKLQVATPGKLSNIHRKKEKDDKGRPLPSSMIGINLVDYSGKTSIFVQENISPSQLRELYNEAIMKRKDYSFSGNGQKIFGNPDQNGYCITRSIYIVRQGSYMSGGRVITKNYPWTIKIQNGRGIKEVNQKTGGTSIKSGSFILEKEATINLSDGDFFTLVDEAISYLTAWELYHAYSFTQAHEKAIKEFDERQRTFTK